MCAPACQCTLELVCVALLIGDGDRAVPCCDSTSYIAVGLAVVLQLQT